MLYLGIESFRSGNLASIRERSVARGRMMPVGLEFRGSWIEPSGARCFQLMETDDRALFEPWIAAWSDLVDFEVIEVLDSPAFWQAFDASGDVSPVESWRASD